jgi:TetR/AcrR family transcriptional regulator
MVELTRKQRERADHRRMILEAAEAVFAQKGFHEATVQEIAERAEFSVGYLYNLFHNKTDIYAELVDMRAAELEADVEERLRHEKDCVAKVRAAIAGKVDFFTRNQQFFLIFARLRPDDRAGGQAVLLDVYRRRHRDYVSRLREVFAEGIRNGIFVDVDPLVLVLCMEGLTNAAIAHWVASEGAEGGVAEPEVLEKVFFRGILVGKDE